jgi:glycerol-3-phosphate acyltransferase PlsY
MAHALPLLAVFALGYLLGSIPFGLILTRAAGLGDVRKIGSGNIGATNVLRTGNKALAAATLLLDGLKGTAAVVLSTYLATRLVTPPLFGPGLEGPFFAFVGFVQASPWVAALGAVIGHIYPVWLGFKGGKGVATYIGVLAGAHWYAAALFAAVWLAVALITRISSLSALAAILSVIAYFALKPHPIVLTAVGLMSLLVVYKHKANIDRLLKGEEPRIGAKG